FAAERDGEPVLLVGEAGIGKTRLLQEHLFDRGDALLVQARPGDAGEPFATLQRLLARLPPDAGEDGKVRPERLRATLRHRLAAAAQAGLRIVAFDDLHFADRASLELLQALAAETTALRWLFAQRPVAGTDEPMAALADSSGTCRLVLAPLQRDALVELLQGLGLPPAELPALAGELLQRCGGNPLFVLETLRAAWRDGAPRGPLALPQGMAHLVGLRLSRLSPEALALARVAAIAAPDFDLALAEQVLGTGALQLAGPWHELEAAQVLRGEQFAHDLIQDAVRAAIPQVIARHAHRQVAACLAARGATPARLARHWQAAGDEHAAAGCYAAAANLAEAACRPREQAELLAACADAHAAAGDADAALRARIARVEALLQSAGSTAAIDAAQALLPACSGALAARAQATLALALCWGGRLDEARAAAQAALNDPAADDDARVRATALLAQAEALQGRPEAGLVLMQPWRVRVEQLGDAALRRDFHGYLSNLLIRLSRSGEALPAAERHLTLARETASAGEELIALMNLAALHGRRGDPERAVAFGREADRLASDIEHSAAIAWWNRGQLGFWLAGTGRFGEALALLEAAAEALDDNPAQRNMALTLLARVWLVLGQPARAHQTLQALTAAPPGPLLVGQLAVRALVSAALGGPALALWREAAGAAGPNEPGVLQARIELACDAGDPDALAALQRRADELEMFPISAEAATRALALSADAGLGCAAEAAERRALGAPGPLFYLPGQLLQCAQAFERAHRPADARRCLDAALHWVHRVALPQLPAPFVEGFLHRNPANVALRAAAARQDGRISGR
ncbi:transcriptional regulator, partial [Rubrivivax gelatinosus]|nr:transcriptional regulator [Rubrivivax gelatinosus]